MKKRRVQGEGEGEGGRGVREVYIDAFMYIYLYMCPEVYTYIFMNVIHLFTYMILKNRSNSNDYPSNQGSEFVWPEISASDQVSKEFMTASKVRWVYVYVQSYLGEDFYVYIQLFFVYV
jgi:hypothetical protein